MKKLFLSLVLGVVMITGTSKVSFAEKDSIPPNDACTGFVYICVSQEAEFQRQQLQNCPAGSAIEFEYLDC
jgi:hypothetical protein